MKTGWFSCLCSIWLTVMAGVVAAAPTSVALHTFSDDEQAEESALNNDNFSSTAPAGPRVTMAVSQALTAAGVTVVSDGSAAAILEGRVTAAWVNPGMLPTNSVSAYFTLTDSSSGAVLVKGNATGAAFDDQEAAAKLGKAIVRKLMR